MEISPKTLQPRLRRAVKWLIPILFLLFSISIVVTLSLKKQAAFRREEVIRKAEIAAGPRVQVAAIEKTPGEHTLTLIGETRPYAQAILYAKVSGYLKEIRVDKGDVVKKNQILAIIESPETDQAYEAALADARNKKAIAMRVKELYTQQLVSPQERDQAIADAGVASANLHAKETLKGYETLRAPFDGTVTARYADPGALVQNASDARTSALPVVTVSQIDRLRVDVFVDQREASYVEADQPVVITWSEPGGAKILGQVSRISNELDPRTKMLLTEIDIPNKNHPLVAGSFVQVALRVKTPPYLMAPVESLLVKGSQSFLTTVTADNRISYKPIEVANNDGKVLWFEPSSPPSPGAQKDAQTNIQVGDRVALNMGDTVPEGGRVRPIPIVEAGKPNP